MILKFMGSRNGLFIIVTILRDIGSGVRFTPEITGLLSSYAFIPFMGPPSPLFGRYWGSFLGVKRLKLEAGNWPPPNAGVKND